MKSRSLAALGMTALAACASVGRPPGGPIDTAPPEIISASIDTNAVGVKASKLTLNFDEVVAERPVAAGGPGSPVTLEAIVLVSPQTGTPKVEWHRGSISIEPRGGLQPNTTYRITLLPGLADLRGNVSKATRSYVFSTGPSIEPYAILGRVFDWMGGVVAPGAIVEAVAHAGTPDSSIYIAAADTIGQFELGPLGAGQYLVRSYIDADHNRERGVVEKWDSATVTVTDHRPSIELLDAQRDTAIVGIQNAEALDSVWVRITLDKPYNPRVQLSSTMVSIKRADSSDVQVEALMTEERAQILRQPHDTTPRLSTGQAATPPVRQPVRPVDSIPSTRPPAARPSVPPPLKVIVARVNPLTPLRTGERYTITVRALPNLIGRAGTSAGVFDGPHPSSKPPL